MLENIKHFILGIKAPWVFTVVLMTTITAIYITANESLGIDQSAFKFNAVLIGGFLSKALLAIAIPAMRTMLLMVGSALLLAVVTLTFTDASSFKDAAVEGTLLMAAGSIVVIIGALLERLKD